MKISKCLGNQNDYRMGVYLQLHWITTSMGVATLDCFVEAGV